jgi:hypothetical protein
MQSHMSCTRSHCSHDSDAIAELGMPKQRWFLCFFLHDTPRLLPCFRNDIICSNSLFKLSDEISNHYHHEVQDRNLMDAVQHIRLSPAHSTSVWVVLGLLRRRPKEIRMLHFSHNSLAIWIWVSLDNENNADNDKLNDNHPPFSPAFTVPKCTNSSLAILR